MKIEKIVIQDYKMFKNFEIDFLDKNNKVLEPIPANLPFIKKIDSTNLH